MHFNKLSGNYPGPLQKSAPRGLRTPYDTEVHHVNPTCGDEITVRVHLEGDGAEPKSLMCRMTAKDVRSARPQPRYWPILLLDIRLAMPWGPWTRVVELMQSRGHIEPDEDVLEDAVAFAGVAKYPARVKCALLGWMAFKDAVAR